MSLILKCGILIFVATSFGFMVGRVSPLSASEFVMYAMIGIVGGAMLIGKVES